MSHPTHTCSYAVRPFVLKNKLFKKYLSLALVILVINLAFGTTAFASAKADKEAKFAAKVKNELLKLGTGINARVEVKLRDKTKLKGYISQINENSFVVVEDNTNTPTEVPYPQTKQSREKQRIARNQTLHRTIQWT